MECPICINEYNKSSRKIVNCRFCFFESCRKCNETYLLSKLSNPHCMNCKTEWGDEVLYDKFTRTFVEKQYKEHRENVLLDREKSLLPATQPIVELQRKQDVFMDEIKYLRDELNEVKAKITRKKWELHKLNIKFQENKNIFIRGCAKSDCRGFLNQRWFCGLCNSKTCKECHEIWEGYHHKCLEENIQTAKFLKKDTKPCPSCATPIYKTEGCMQMFCQSEDTEIWLWDGTKKLARDISIEDVLIGEDGKPRFITQMTKGEDILYLVEHQDGTSYKVIGNHLLSLVSETSNKIVDISVLDYLNIPNRFQFKRYVCSLIQWEEQPLPLDPYIFGLWLSCGTANSKCYTTNDIGFHSTNIKIVHEWFKWAMQNNINMIHVGPNEFLISKNNRSPPVCVACQEKVSIYCATLNELEELLDLNLKERTTILNLPSNEVETPLLEEVYNWKVNVKDSSCDIHQILKDMNVLVDKHIPSIYLVNSVKNRMELLAGILDGKSTFKYHQHFLDLCRSLGLAVDSKSNLYNMENIPTRIITKSPKGFQNNSIKITKMDTGKFVGWSITGGSPRYLLGDGTVTHNCTICHVAFDWNSGRLETGVIHNPHYYEWQRQHGNTERVLGDVRCGGLPYFNVFRRCGFIPRESEGLLNQFHQTIQHILYVEIPRIPRVVDQNRNEDLRIKFLKNEINEDDLKIQIQKREKKSKRKYVYGRVLDMFVTVGTDIIQKMAVEKRDYIEELMELLYYTNNEIINLKTTYKCNFKPIQLINFGTYFY